jgi:hypothetical protein
MSPGDPTGTLVYLLCFFGGMVVLAGLAGAGERLEARSPRFSRLLDRWIGRPGGWR